MMLRVLLLAYVILTFGQTAASRACEAGESPLIHVVADPTSVQIASHLTGTEIADLARRGGQSDGPTPSGFYVSQVVNQVHVEPSSPTKGACPSNLLVVVTLTLANRRIEVARELLEEPCRLKAVVAHYRKKAEADQRVFDDYVMTVGNALHTALMPLLQKDIDEVSLPLVRQNIEAWVRDVVSPKLEALHATRVAALKAVDSADEMQRLSSACGQGI